MRLSVLAFAGVLLVPSLAAAQPVARSVETISVPPVLGTVTDAESMRLTGLVRNQVDAAGFTSLAAARPELTGDALLETIVVADAQGCDVDATLRTKSGTPLRGHTTCDAASGKNVAAQVTSAVTRDRKSVV